MINVTLKIIPMITSNIQLYKLFSVHANSDLFTADVLLVLSKCSLVTQKIIILLILYITCKNPPKFGWMSLSEPYCWTSKFESSHFSSVNATIQQNV